MISVLMSVYNNESTIRDAIDSIVDQSETDWELLICDDGSTDQTLRIIQGFSSEDPRIKVLRNETNKGLAYSLNKCLRKANGNYIARMDGDDLSEPDRFLTQKKYLDQNPDIDLVGTAMQVFDEAGNREIIYTPSSPQKTDLPKRTPFSHATIMMRTDVLRQLGGYVSSNRTQRTEDMELWYRFFSNGYCGTNLPDPLYKVRVDRNALKRRKLKFALDASVITFKGIGMLNLPFYYRAYCLRPLVSYFIPENFKRKIRKS